MTLKTPFWLRRGTRRKESRAQIHTEGANSLKGLRRMNQGSKRGELAGIRTQDPRLKRALLYQLSYELAIRPLSQNYHKVTGPP
jgi:hypothetical protein